MSQFQAMFDYRRLQEAPSGNQIQHTFGGVKVTSTCSEKNAFPQILFRLPKGTWTNTPFSGWLVFVGLHPSYEWDSNFGKLTTKGGVPRYKLVYIF